MGLCGVGESHAPDAFAAVLNPTTDTHLSVTRIHNDGIMQGAALPSMPPVWVATRACRWWLALPPCFYPRHPCGWRPQQGPRAEPAEQVSIHATRVGGDALDGLLVQLSSCFYPRHPCGWRLFKIAQIQTNRSQCSGAVTYQHTISKRKQCIDIV